MVVPLIMGLIAATPVSAAGEVAVEINSPEEVYEDSYFIVTVEISEVSKMNAFQFDVIYDSSILSLNSVNNGRINDIGLQVLSNQKSPGQLRVIFYKSSGSVSGSGYLAALNFSTLKSGTSKINLVNGIISGVSTEIPATWTGFSVNVISIESGESESENESLLITDESSTGGFASTGGTSLTTGIGITEISSEEPIIGINTAIDNEEPTIETESYDEKVAAYSELEYNISSTDRIAVSSETSAENINNGDDSKESISRDSSNEYYDVVKWPVLWSIIGVVVTIIGLVVYLKIKNRYFI
jgi:hypothetical protein